MPIEVINFIIIRQEAKAKAKQDLKENTRKGYQQGVEQGYKKAQKLIYNLFDKHLNYEVKNSGK